jgi:predicted Fe-Mo cluster-binding NifX family protein
MNGANRTDPSTGDSLTVAVPADGQLIAPHIGQAPSIVFAKVAGGKVRNVQIESNPLRATGGFSRFLVERGVSMVLMGDAGPQLKRRLAERGISVSTGHSGPIEKALAELSTRQIPQQTKQLPGD